jgi:hypothetical protein
VNPGHTHSSARRLPYAHISLLSNVLDTTSFSTSTHDLHGLHHSSVLFLTFIVPYVPYCPCPSRVVINLLIIVVISTDGLWQSQC